MPVGLLVNNENGQTQITSGSLNYQLEATGTVSSFSRVTGTGDTVLHSATVSLASADEKIIVPVSSDLFVVPMVSASPTGFTVYTSGSSGTVTYYVFAKNLPPVSGQSLLRINASNGDLAFDVSRNSMLILGEGTHALSSSNQYPNTVTMSGVTSSDLILAKNNIGYLLGVSPSFGDIYIWQSALKYSGASILHTTILSFFGGLGGDTPSVSVAQDLDWMRIRTKI